MAPRFMLTYFDALGRGEAVRYLLAHIGKPYDDCRIKPEDWPKLKETMPTGTLPTLEFDGKVIAQTHSILGYLGKTFNLCGKDDYETAKCYMLTGTVEDLYQNISCDEINPFLEGKFTQEQRKAKIDDLGKKVVEPFMVRMEKILNESQSGYFVGDSLTFADFSVFHCFSYLKSPYCFWLNCLDSHPKLVAFNEKIAALPGVNKHIAERPQTPW